MEARAMEAKAAAGEAAGDPPAAGIDPARAMAAAGEAAGDPAAAGIDPASAMEARAMEAADGGGGALVANPTSNDDFDMLWPRSVFHLGFHFIVGYATLGTCFSISFKC